MGGNNQRRPGLRGPAGIFGYSLGAFLAVSAGAHDARVDAVAELSGGIFDYLHGRLQRVPPTLILHGLDDARVNIRQAYALDAEARRHGVAPAMHLYSREGHVLSRPALEDASARVLDFLDTELRAGK